jgi:hypothetical protein
MPGQYFGKYTGTVKDNRDDQNLGRLQVSVPTQFPPDELVTARAALPYGFFFVPEQEAKVWVEFEGGDPGLPIWTGVLYVPGQWPEEAKANPPQRRVIKTASGHVVTFNDKGGEEKIEIRDGVNGHVITLAKNGLKITDGVSGHEVAFTAQGINVHDGVNKHSLTLDASGVAVTAATGAKVQLTAALTAVDAGPGVVEVKGAVIKLSAAATWPVIRVTDQGIGNLGAPVIMVGPGNPAVLA